MAEVEGDLYECPPEEGDIDRRLDLELTSLAGWRRRDALIEVVHDRAIAVSKDEALVGMLAAHAFHDRSNLLLVSTDLDAWITGPVGAPLYLRGPGERDFTLARDA